MSERVKETRERKGDNHNALAESNPSVQICNAVMDMHLDGLSVLDKDLFEQHASDLACIDVGVWNEMSIWPVGACPAQTEPFFFGGSMLDEDVALPRNLAFHSASKRLD